MLYQISQRFKLGVERFLPNPFIFALILTIITLLAGIILTNESLFSMIEHWYGGFWDFLGFSMQMILIIITGYALVQAPIVQKWVQKGASIPKNQKSAIIITMIVAAVSGFISWGLGFILGTLFAIEVAKKVRSADFRILIAAAYTSTISILPISITLTAPILVNTPGHSLEDKMGLIPLTETIFSPTMLFMAFIGFASMLFIYIRMMPKKEDIIPIQLNNETAATLETNQTTIAKPSIADRLDNNKIINYIVVSIGMIWIVSYFYHNGFNLDLNILNFTFIILGLILHGSPKSYVNAITKGMPSASGIALQFPFYAGIMGMMAGSGLVYIIANGVVSISNEFTFPFFSYASSIFISIFVPSAGGQWQLQGPIMVEAAQALGVSLTVPVNTYSIGDLVANLIQPFFVLPALGLSGLSLKDIWGYCLVSLIVLFIIGTIAVTFIPIIF
ncbi:short-chain fatty acids transporter [Cytobacillus horneckiae]|uniref:short-chain fatty acid transporter n=1 Tax=Cytobacillus horneckiae TaxID=549687 RepID=UPI000B20E9C3|nr:TIGR00366 family protein [Cytobacillus horneckiae]MBN6886091.1 short-chain fatty acid transporter [Cytobacillus horneckiae]MCM3176393.1 TIGR00366 family protein [Cytobacillus horneckiae]MEC1155773.1 TIGR00366 family protein [Cytobacillus horneckiae]MED2939312.1 TIGR00366 family protein [Cytobacillus horneckiae]